MNKILNEKINNKSLEKILNNIFEFDSSVAFVSDIAFDGFHFNEKAYKNLLLTASLSR